MKDVMLSELGLQMLRELVRAAVIDRDNGRDKTVELFGDETRRLVNDWAEEIDELKREALLYLSQINEIEE
jgi:hypothetical protein